MAATQQSDDEIISGINVTPLVDIILVVLIIFIVTASFVLRHNVPVELPSAQTAEEGRGGLLNLAITKDGELFINGAPGDLDGIAAKVAEAREKVKVEGGQLSAYVSADKRADYGSFAAVVDRLRLEGVTDIALDTSPVEVEEPEP
jgi:biopolymer transport protein ExbD